MVWWDYFGDRTSSERWPHLDVFILGYEHHENAQPLSIQNALLELGYPESDARQRSVMPESNYWTARAMPE